MSQYQQRQVELVYFPKQPPGRDNYAQRLRKAFAEALHAQGLRLTAERQAILSVLVEARHHLSIEELFAQACRRHHRLGRATMFRTLKVLREAGLVSRIAVPDNGYRYEAYYERPHHDHLICVVCGRILEVQWPEVERVQERTCRVYHFTPLWHRHEIFGRCRSCQQEKSVASLAHTPPHPFRAPPPTAIPVGGHTVPPPTLSPQGGERMKVRGDVRGLKKVGLRLAGSLVALLLTTFATAVPTSSTRAQYLMGTLCEITVFGDDPRQITGIISQAFAEIARLERLMSLYQPDSELSILNRTAYRQPVACSPELFTVLKEAVRYHDLTQGAFDVTVLPLIQLWRDIAHEGGPSLPALTRTVGLVGSHGLRMEPRARRVVFEREGMAIDLGGIGKGYALDAAVTVLRRHGITAALVNFGGQLLALGHPPGRSGWDIAIADPRDERKIALRICVRDRSVATSSQTQRFSRIKGGQRVGHILDPRTGGPVAWGGSVTVIAPTGTGADALSTGLFVLGPGKGLHLADRLSEIGAIFLDPGDQEKPLTVQLSRGCGSFEVQHTM